MAKAIELRQFMPRFTLEHLKAGMQPIPQKTADGARELYAPPVLQYRVREKAHVDGQPTLQWSAWEDVRYVREGDEPAT